MRNIFHIHTVLLSLLSLCLLSCTREPLLDGSDCTGREVVARLSFAPQENSIVTTRAAVTSTAENRILNLFVFLFDTNGNKLYSQYFDSSNKASGVTSTSGLTGENTWWVDNSASTVAGGVCIKSSSGSGYKIYVMANLDADMVRVSSDLLSHNIDNEQDLLDFSVYLNQEIISRNGYFPMTGMLSDLKIADDGTITKTDGTAAGTLMLRRLDAKVKFIFKVDPENERRADAAGQKIKSFAAKQWKVLNLPATSFLVEHTADAVDVDPATSTTEYVTYAPKFFDTEWTNFEEFPDDNTSTFTFYMLENRQTPKNTVSSYQDRSRQVKQTSGYHIGENETVTVSYVNSRGMDVTRDMRVFQNANDFSTYVLVTGTVEMELENDDQGKILGGDVQYLIHLGDWSFTEGSSWDTDTYGSVNNFDTERNTFYTYTVTVNSVNNIRVEVESSKTASTLDEVIENQPGATGQVTIAKEEIAVCDAHYYSKTMTFHASNFLDDNNYSTAGDLTWSVKTPFSDGTPADPLSPGTLDYDWVHFRLNKKNSDGTYNENRRKFVDPSRKFETTTVERSASQNAEGDGTDGLAGYHNDGLMNIVDLVKYIKEQVELLEDYYQEGGEYKGDFDNYTDKTKAKICVTAFVDEFYYDKNPVTGVTSQTLWKSFVNQPDRSLHILCNSEVSKDLESRATGSVVTIQQHAIQSIYNTDASETSLKTAWGLEYIDEFTDVVTTYNASSSTYTGSYSNTSQSDGLYNSVQEWYTGNDTWSTYLDFEVKNDVPQMQSDYKGLRYICLARNRDNNGNGTIDPDEFRWYTASIRQLIGIYVGNGVIDHHSRLYYRSASEQASSDANTWRQHIISSTLYGSGEPTVVWGEEGISTGKISGSISWGGGLNKFSVRCVRNLGLENPSSYDFAEGTYQPQDYVEVEHSNEGQNDDVVTFECTHLDDAALRYYTSRELDFHSHTSDINRLYKKFEVLPTSEATTTSNMTFKTLNDNLTTAINAGNQNPYCPEGYRLPNQTELAMMKYYNVISKEMVSRTYWAYGSDRTDGVTAKEDKHGYIYAGGNISLESSGKAFVCRCVRDIRTD